MGPIVGVGRGRVPVGRGVGIPRSGVDEARIELDPFVAVVVLDPAVNSRVGDQLRVFEGICVEQLLRLGDREILNVLPAREALSSGGAQQGEEDLGALLQKLRNVGSLGDEVLLPRVGEHAGDEHSSLRGRQLSDAKTRWESRGPQECHEQRRPIESVASVREKRSARAAQRASVDLEGQGVTNVLEEVLGIDSELTEAFGDERVRRVRLERGIEQGLELCCDGTDLDRGGSRRDGRAEAQAAGGGPRVERLWCIGRHLETQGDLGVGARLDIAQVPSQDSSIDTRAGDRLDECHSRRQHVGEHHSAHLRCRVGVEDPELDLDHLSRRDVSGKHAGRRGDGERWQIRARLRCARRWYGETAEGCRQIQKDSSIQISFHVAFPENHESTRRC